MSPGIGQPQLYLSHVEVSPELKDKAQNHETITWPPRVDAASERLKRCLMPHVVDSPVCTELDTNGFVVKGEGATPTDPQREKEPEVVYPGEPSWRKVFRSVLYQFKQFSGIDMMNYTNYTNSGLA